MNILIELGYQHFTVSPEHTDKLVALLPHLRKVDVSGYGEATTYTVEAMPPKAEFIASEKLAPLNPREAALKEALEKKDAQWVGAFTERDAQKKRADELEREVNRLRAGIPSVADDERAP